MKTLNQKKKELFELLHEYFSMKPKEQWCVDTRDDRNGRHCALGLLDKDFGGFLNDVTRTVTRLTTIGECGGSDLVKANNGRRSYGGTRLPGNPKDRVLDYLKKEISKL